MTSAAQSTLTHAQVDQLLKPINPRRVIKRDGQSNVAQQDVVAHLTRIFGFTGWDKDIQLLELVYETETVTKGYNGQAGKPAWAVCYRCRMRLTIKAPDGTVLTYREDAATGQSTQPDRGKAHDAAYKNAVSYAIKRCAKDFGDQFGLSLYNKGQTSALVGGVLVGRAEADDVAQADRDAGDTQSLGNDEVDTDEDAPAPAPAAATPPPAAPRVDPVAKAREDLAARQAAAQVAAASIPPPAATERAAAHQAADSGPAAGSVTDAVRTVLEAIDCADADELGRLFQEARATDDGQEMLATDVLPEIRSGLIPDVILDTLNLRQRAEDGGLLKVGTILMVAGSWIRRHSAAVASGE